MIWNRLLKRMPSLAGLLKFWLPTNCAMCYWLRLAIIVTNASLFPMFGFCLAAVFTIIGLYYGLRSSSNQLKDLKK